jgi:hypothetical protein
MRQQTERHQDAAERTIEGGVVRLTIQELASRRRSRLSRRELTPFRECGSAVLFEGIAHRRRLRILAQRLKPIYSDNAAPGTRSDCIPHPCGRRG